MYACDYLPCDWLCPVEADSADWLCPVDADSADWLCPVEADSADWLCPVEADTAVAHLLNPFLNINISKGENTHGNFNIDYEKTS